MVNDVRGWEQSGKLKHEKNVYVRNFPGGKVRSMKNYVKPLIRDNDPQRIILHVGTNELNLESISERKTKPNVDLADSLISEKRRVIFSGIILRNDEWNNKAENVNSNLTDM